MSEEIVVLVTASRLPQARQIAEALVSRRLVACANLVPGVESVYRWQGEVQRDSEILLILKTTRARFAEVAAAVQELHTYEIPEVIALPIEEGSRAYLGWLRDCVKEVAPEGPSGIKE